LKVYGIGKIEDIFSKSGITHAVHTGSNKQGLELTLEAVKNENAGEIVALPNVAGGEGIDWSKGIERLKQWKEEKEAKNYYF